MPRYADNIYDEYRRPVLGAQIYVRRTEDRSTPPLTDDAGLTLVQPLTSDRFGLFSFNAPNGLYDFEVRFAGRLRHREGSVLVGVYSSGGGDGGGPGTLFFPALGAWSDAELFYDTALWKDA